MDNEYLTLDERKRQRTRKIVTAIASVLVLAGLVWGIGKLSESSKKQLATGDIPPVTADDKIAGKTDAKVVLIEYADFQCPACRAKDVLLKQLLQEYPNQVAIVHRNFPLKTIHKTAVVSAAAAEAAAKQGRFWEMHDKLYATQETWADQPNAGELFVGFAKDLGMNTDQFRTDMNSTEVLNKIEADYQKAGELSLDHTPTFALNGKILPDPNSYADFKDIVENALK